MPIKPGTFAFTVLLALLTATGPLATDMYLPSLPSIAGDLGAGVATTQLTLSGFLIGFGGGQLIYGPLSDRFGRKPVLLTTLAVYLVASAGCALASDINMLILMRALQGLGGAGPAVLARAVTRDIFSGRQAARMLSHMGAVMGLVPVLAPVVGAVVHESFGWRAVFAVIFVFGAGLAAAAILRLGESLKPENRQPLSFTSLGTTYLALFKSRRYRFFVAAVCLGYGGLFAYISGASFVIQDHLGYGPRAFAIAFSASVWGFICGTLTAGRLVLRLGIARVIFIGALMLALGGVVMLASMVSGIGGIYGLFAAMSVYLFGIGFVLPQSMAGALMPFPDRAGAASSVLGFMQMIAGAGVGVAVGHGLAISPLALPVTIAAMGLCAVAVAVAAGWHRDTGEEDFIDEVPPAAGPPSL